MQNLHATSNPSAPVNAALQSGHELQPRVIGTRPARRKNVNKRTMIIPLSCIVFWTDFLRPLTWVGMFGYSCVFGPFILWVSFEWKNGKMEKRCPAHTCALTYLRVLPSNLSHIRDNPTLKNRAKFSHLQQTSGANSTPNKAICSI